MMPSSLFRAMASKSIFRNLIKQGDNKEVIETHESTPIKDRTISETQEYYTALKHSSINSLLTPDNSLKKLYLQPEHTSLISSKKKFRSNGKNQYLKYLLDPFNYLFIYFILSLYFEGFKNPFIETESQYFVETDTKVRFRDVKGIDEYRQELEDIVDYLKNQKKYKEAGVKPTKGILLSGKPGTGKTLLAKAIAGESGVSFIKASGSAFEEKFVGVGPKRIRELFSLARKNLPCIIFIDEIDSIAQSRNYRNSIYTHDTLNQLLVEIDGFKQDENIIIIGATNFFESLDKALLRSGRFDKKIELPVPDRQARAEILEYYLGKIKTDETISLRLLISRSYGMTGADIENLVNLAALHAVQRGEQVASWEDFEYAIDRVTMGIGHKSLAVSEVDIQNTVYHELGHATVAFYTEGANELQKITILPRGQSLGHTAFVLHKEDAPFTKQEVLAQIDVCMGGRAAEEVFFGEKNITTGCSNDLKNATSLAYSGLSAGLFNEITGLGSFKELEDLGSHQRNELDKAVFEILTSSYNRALRVIREKVSVIHTLAKELRAKETLSKDQFIEIIEKSKLA